MTKKTVLNLLKSNVLFWKLIVSGEASNIFMRWTHIIFSKIINSEFNQ